MENSTETIYKHLTAEQRAAIAQQYLAEFNQSGNAATKQKFANVDPNTVSAQQLTEMHQHAATNHPGLLDRIRNHPMVAAALGAIAAYELDKHFAK